MRPRARILIDVSPKTALVMIVAVGAVWLLIHLLPVLLVIVTGLMIAGMVSPIVAWLEQRGLGRGTSIGLVFVSMLVAAGVLGALTVPRLGAQLWELSDRLPHMQSAFAQ